MTDMHMDYWPENTSAKKAATMAPAQGIEEIALASVSDGDAYDIASLHAHSEVRRALELWPRPFYNAHEGYATLLEEVDEFWDEVKVNQTKRDPAKMRKEALQIAAMALRVAVECCTEEACRR